MSNDMSLNTNIDLSIIPDDFKNQIIKEIILPYYKSNIQYVINTKSNWSKVGTGFLTISTVLIGASSILSFASSTYPDRNLNFIAGSIGLLSLICKEFASYANSVDHIKTLTINDLLKNVGIKHVMNDTSINFQQIMDKSKVENNTEITEMLNKIVNHLDINPEV